MKSFQKHLIVIHLLLIGNVIIPLCASASSGKAMHRKIIWEERLTIPAVDGKPSIGVAGAFAGMLGGNIIVAGGANFPDTTPWNGGTKTWWRTAYLIPTDGTPATTVENALPHPIAYGVSIQLPESILCIGGCDAHQCYQDVFLLHLKDGQLQIDTDWPPLPVPLANAAGTLSGQKIYLAGGQERMDEQTATRHFFVLDLADKEKGWEELEPWPGKARGYAVCTAQDNGSGHCVYLFSGRDYDSSGKLDILFDGYVFNPRLNAWKKLEGHFPVMAGTAIATGANHILFFGGSDKIIPGSDHHPGFEPIVREYHTITNTLTDIDTAQYRIPVTTTAIQNGQTVYFGSGEIFPGIRTPFLLKAEIVPPSKETGRLDPESSFH